MIIIVAAAIIILMAGEIAIVKSISDFNPKIKVVYAKRSIAAKEEIVPEMVEIKEVDMKYVHSLSCNSLEDVMGKRTRMPVERGEMILSSKLGPVNDLPEIKLNDEDNRLFTVEFKPDQANGWWLMANQYVDIIYVPNLAQGMNVINTTSPQGAAQNDDAIYDMSRVVRMDNIRVAAIIDEKGNMLSNDKRESIPRFVSFEVNYEQDAFLAYAKGNGRLEISVRPSK